MGQHKPTSIEDAAQLIATELITVVFSGELVEGIQTLQSYTIRKEDAIANNIDIASIESGNFQNEEIENLRNLIDSGDIKVRKSNVNIDFDETPFPQNRSVTFSWPMILL